MKEIYLKCFKVFTKLCLYMSFYTLPEICSFISQPNLAKMQTHAVHWVAKKCTLNILPIKNKTSFELLSNYAQGIQAPQHQNLNKSGKNDITNNF